MFTVTYLLPSGATIEKHYYSMTLNQAVAVSKSVASKRGWKAVSVTKEY